MKFQLKENEDRLECYGYIFIPGQETDVKEKHLITKFQKYHQLEAAKRGPKPKAKAEDKKD